MGNSRFSDGFFFGALIGGAAVFLIGTKKGNKILKAMGEEGISGLTNVFEDIEQKIDGVKPLPPTSKKAKPETKKPEPVLDIDHVEERIELEPIVTTEENDPSSSRRFFKRKN